MTSPNLSGLIERLRAATSGSFWLDREICRALDWLPEGVVNSDPPEYWFSEAWGMPKPSRDLSAIVALAEKRLPGWRYDLHSPRRGIPWEAVVMEDKESRRIIVGKGASMSLALCLALLITLQSEVSHV